LAIALAFPAAGLAAGATVTQNKGRAVGTGFMICGLDLNYDFYYSGVEVIRASGVELDAGQSTSIWTNPDSGKTIMIHGGGLLTTGAAIDNGDGTISFIQASDGNYLVKSADGAPLSLRAGRLVVKVTVDAVTGDFISAVPLAVDGTNSGPSAD